MINTALSQITVLEEKFVQDANDLLDRIDTLIDKASCLADGVTGTILSATRAAADDGLIPNPFEPCRKEQDLGFRRVASLDNYSLYKFFKCRILEKIDSKTSLQDMLGYLGEGQRTAAQFRCMSRSSPDASKVYTKEFIQWGEWYDAWSPSSNGYSLDDVVNKETTRRLRVTVGKPPAIVVGKPLTSTVSFDQVSGAAASCGTMFDCYTQAMEALKEAQSEITSCKQTFEAQMTATQAAVAQAQSTATSALEKIPQRKMVKFQMSVGDWSNTDTGYDSSWTLSVVGIYSEQVEGALHNPMLGMEFYVYVQNGRWVLRSELHGLTESSRIDLLAIPNEYF